MRRRRSGWPWGIAIACALVASLALLLAGGSIEIPVCESGNYEARSHAISTASTLFFSGAVSGAAALLLSIGALAVCRGKRLFFIAPLALSAFFVYWGALAALGTALACAFS